MSQTYIVIDQEKDWAPFYPSENVLTFKQYLNGDYPEEKQRIRLINLCSSYKYLSAGYYCSLLAEGRNHHVIPAVQTLNDLSKRALYQLQLDDFSQSLRKGSQNSSAESEITLLSFFGTAADPAYSEIARKLFELFPCPILEAKVRYKQTLEVTSLRPVSHKDLSEDDETHFAQALDKYSQNVWSKKRSQKPSRYDLAILLDPEEPLPPSDPGAIKRFIKAGKELGIECELITQKDYQRLPEFDGLFIRTTTNIDHYTFRFAKKAEAEDLAVIDDPTSILRCTNKVYLSDLFKTYKVPTPRSKLLHKADKTQVEWLEQNLGYPIVIKIPDGSFSRGVERVKDRTELEDALTRLFKKSTLLLAQEFLYTDFDWRIGILDNKPLYACRYYMVKNHWQIYRHNSDKGGGRGVTTGGFDTLPTFEVPQAVLNSAMRATKPIGNGFYGVDVKEKDGQGYVIEVNDNPSIDSGVEDKYLGDELYRRIMQDLLHRMESRRQGKG